MSTLEKEFIFGNYRIPFQLRMPWTENINVFIEHIVGFHNYLSNEYYNDF